MRDYIHELAPLVSVSPERPRMRTGALEPGSLFPLTLDSAYPPGQGSDFPVRSARIYNAAPKRG